MKKKGVELGGEQSGHIIFREHSSTGDGIVCALQLARIMKESGKKLSELASIIERFPQKLVNIDVREKKPFEEMKKVKEAIKKAEKELGKNGRVVVRYSGTENKARVMIEAKEIGQVERLTEEIASEIREEIGK